MRLKQDPSAPESAHRKDITNSFHSLTTSDAPLIEILCVDFAVSAKEPKHLEKVADAISRCSYASKSQAKIIGTLTWLILRQSSPALNAKFAMYLKTLYDKEIVNEEAIRAWYESPHEKLVEDIHNGDVSAADLAALKKATNIFIQFLDKQNEEEEEDDEEEDDDEDEA